MLKNLTITEKSNVKNLLASLKNMPPLKAQEWRAIKAEQTIICEEREYASLCMDSNEEKNENPMRYLGSKNVRSCVFVYLYSPMDHLMIHIVDSRPINLSELATNFKNKNELSVILVGGEMLQEPARSKANVNFVLSQLIDLAKTFNTTIRIEAQRLLNHHIFDASINSMDRKVYLYNYLCNKISDYYYYLYGKRLDINAQNFSPIGFRDQRGTNSSRINTFIDELISVDTLYLTEDNSMLKKFPENKKPENFLNYASKIFTVDTYNKIKDSKIQNDIPSLTDFVVDINSKEILFIPETLIIPHTNARKLEIYFASKYRECFKQGKYIEPEFHANWGIIAKRVIQNGKCPRYFTQEQVAILKKHMSAKYANDEVIVKTIFKYFQDEQAKLFSSADVSDHFTLFNSAIQNNNAIIKDKPTTKSEISAPTNN